MPVLNNQSAYPKLLVEPLKRLVFKYTPFGAPNNPYNVDPIQLATIINELVRMQYTLGTVVEIGVARGMTTRFMAEHLVSLGINNQEIFAIDTFNAFVKNDIDYEVSRRDKNRNELTNFNYITYDKWRKNFSQYSICKADTDGLNKI